MTWPHAQILGARKGMISGDADVAAVGDHQFEAGETLADLFFGVVDRSGFLGLVAVGGAAEDGPDQFDAALLRGDDLGGRRAPGDFGRPAKPTRRNCEELLVKFAECDARTGSGL